MDHKLRHRIRQHAMRWQAVFDMTILLRHSHSLRKNVELPPLSFALLPYSGNLRPLRWHIYVMANGSGGLAGLKPPL